MTAQVDVVVVGLGVGGEEVAGRLAEAGLEVVGVDDGLVGGECPYWGCVPSKMMIRAANLIAETRRVGGMAGASTVTPDWAPVARRIREEATDDWDDKVAVERLVGKGATFLRERGRLIGPHRVVAGGKEFETRRSSDVAQQALERDGITFHVGTQAKRVEHRHHGFTISLDTGETISGDKLLVATGRRVDIAGLGLDAAGLDPGARSIETDERMRAADGLWAVGDVTGHGAFTHMAMYQANIAVHDILGSENAPAADYRAVPRVTFTDPEIGAVGMTEQQARDAGIEVRIGSAKLPESARGWIHKAGNDGFVKLVVDGRRDVLVGATTTGPTGGEMLGALAVAVKAEVPVPVLRETIYAYPTFHRAIGDALRTL